MSSVCLKASATAALAANDQLQPEQVPSLEERAVAIAACIPIPHGVTTLISKYAMERFDGEMFGPQQWQTCWGATPVSLLTVEKLRERVVQFITSTGIQLEKEVGEMNAEECANFLEVQGEEEHPEPPDELYECLNRRLRPQDKLVAGFTCVVTYIPQFVRKNDEIQAVTARRLAVDLAASPVQGSASQLLRPINTLMDVLTPQDTVETEPSCYFMMERDAAFDTTNESSTSNEGVSSQQNDDWQLPQPRNFFATVFSIRVWKGQFLFGTTPKIFVYGQGQSKNGRLFVMGNFGVNGLDVKYSEGNEGECASRKFMPQLRSSAPK